MRFEYSKISPPGYTHLGWLERLEALAFKNCSMHDEDLRFVRGLPELRRIYLDNPLNGQITDAGLQHLEPLHKLEHVVLDGLSIGDEGIAVLENAPNLRHVVISSRKVTENGVMRLLRSRSRCDLEVLKLNIEEITDTFPSWIGIMPRLKRLSIGTNRLTNRGLASFQRDPAPGLEELNIYSCEGEDPPTSAGLKHLSTLQSLRVLRLDTAVVDSEDLRYLARLRNLRILVLGGLVLDDTAVIYLSQLPRLEELGPDGVQLSEEGRRNLQSLSRIRAVWFDHTSRVTNEGLLSLEGLPRLEELSFWHAPNVPSDEVRDRLAGIRFTIYE